MTGVLPPPQLPQLPPLEPERKHPTLKILGITAAALIGLGLFSTIDHGGDDDDGGGRKMTLTEAVCKMMREGDTAEEAYGAAKILASQHPLVYGEDESTAARAAVIAAQGQGCG